MAQDTDEYQPRQHIWLVVEFYTLTSAKYATAAEYRTAFERVRQDLLSAGRPNSEMEDIIAFVHGAAAKYPAWASSLRSNRLPLKLDAVMDDLVQKVDGSRG